MLEKAEGMDRKSSDEWAIKFMIAYGINTLFLDPFMVVLKVFFYPWALKQIVSNQTTPIVFFVFFLINHGDIKSFYKL
jgi:hypothetical protein